MKIVIVGARWNPYLVGKVRGGAEKVEANQIILLKDAGHEVHFLTNDDSEDPPYPEVKTHRVGASRHSGKPIFAKERNQIVRDIIKRVEPDVVICHDSDNSSLNRILTPLRPCVNFVHSHVGMAGGISALSYIGTLYKMAKEGHATVCVAASSRREWLQLSRKSKKFLISSGIPEEDILSEDAIFTHWFHHAITWKKPILKPAKKGFITIGRIIPTKRHHISLFAADDLRLFCPPPDHPDQKELYEKLVKKFGSERINATGVSDEILEEEIATSKALLCFAQESFGLTAVEANIQGIPVILSHKIEDHPIKEACAPSSHVGGIVVIPHELGKEGIREFLLSYETPSDEERQKILDETWDYYNPKAGLARLESLLEETIKRWERVQASKPAETSEDVLGMFG